MNPLGYIPFAAWEATCAAACEAGFKAAYADTLAAVTADTAYTASQITEVRTRGATRAATELAARIEAEDAIDHAIDVFPAGEHVIADITLMRNATRAGIGTDIVRATREAGRNATWATEPTPPGGRRE